MNRLKKRLLESALLLILKMKSGSNDLEARNESVLCVEPCFKIFVIQHVYNIKYFTNLQKMVQTKTSLVCGGNRLGFFTTLSILQQVVGEVGNGKNRESQWLSIHFIGLCDLFGLCFSSLKM